MTNKYKMLRVCATDLFAKTALLPEIDFLQKKGWSIDIAFPEDKETKSLIKNNEINFILFCVIVVMIFFIISERELINCFIELITIFIDINYA